MLRRTIALALAGLALAAPPALADSHWNSQMKDATATASRSAGGCSIQPGRHQGSLYVSCNHKEHATLIYSFPIRNGSQIQGKPWCGVTWGGLADVHHSWKLSGGALRVTVTVANGTALLSTVSVGYYTK
jgi:hypothetical protein